MNDAILTVRELARYFRSPSMLDKSTDTVKAVDGVSFAIQHGEIFALVGESGCGKSTLARVILRLLDATKGEVEIDGAKVQLLKGKMLHDFRRNVQMIFQDPYDSLNPRWRVGKIVAEPLVAHHIGSPKEHKKLVAEMLQIVGLSPDYVNRYPHEFSGGQRQRIGIARALITKPKLVICDEPISALDVSIQAQIINLLKDLQQQFHLSYLFITHDLRVVKYLCDRVGVMYLGKMAEIATQQEIFDNPLHPYTKALFSAIPYPDPEYKKEQIILEGDLPSPINPPSGCYFHTRCPAMMEICRREQPEMKEVSKGHFCACHLYQAMQ